MSIIKRIVKSENQSLTALIFAYRFFYWFGSYYALSLFVQAVNMIFVQLVLLKIALTNRPTPGGKESVEHVPFSGQRQDSSLMGFPRPYNFWRWRNEKPYVHRLVTFPLAFSFRRGKEREETSKERITNMLTMAIQILDIPELFHRHPLRDTRFSPFHLPN